MSTQPDIALSVVLPVYAGADPDHFRAALASVYAQTLRPVEILVVEDGPLTPAHYDVLAGFAGEQPPPRRITLPDNRGAAAANQAGLAAASCPWIAKADADDINEPDRFALQAAALSAGGWDLVGTAMTEFDDGTGTVIGVRSMPEAPADITRAARANNPFNHPTVVYRRDLALAVGGYGPPAHMEDYDLLARMLAAGARATNLPHALVRFRGGDAMLARRRSPGILRSELQMQRNLHEYGLISGPRMALNLALRTTYRLLPTQMLRWANRILFHRG